MPKLNTESENQFLTRIKDDFKDRHEDLIMIEDGGFFIGSWEQLESCFFLYPEELYEFCEKNNLNYEIIFNK